MDDQENKRKHLEFIQSNIARMNQCSFQIKGWTITVVTAMLAIYAASIVPETGTGNDMFLFVAVVPTFVFWLLDTYYLQQGRKFRGIYNDVIGITHVADVRDFEMPLNQYCGCKYCFWKILWSITEAPLYLTVILGLTIAGYFL